MMKRIIALLILIALFIMPISVFADGVPIPDPPYGAYDYWAVVHGTIGKVLLITTANPMKASIKGDQIYTQGSYRMYSLVDGHWSYEHEGLNGSIPIDDIYASNQDIEYNDGSGFFFTLPKVSVLYRVLETMDSGVLLKIISAGLIPLVGLIVLVISFRKGWDFLLNQLMH